MDSGVAENIFELASKAAAKIGPSVVQITPDKWNGSGRPGPRALGSGLVVDPQGYILTSNNVVEKGPHAVVSLTNGQRAEAEVAGSDPRLDLGLLHAPSLSQLPEPPLGNSDQVEIGDTVIAVGNPFGLDWTVAFGVISGLERSIITSNNALDGLLQTDTVINPGSSGGPLANLNGEVIGITSAKLGGRQGLNFAIPINLALRVYRELREQGQVRHPWLGIEGQTERVDPQWIEMFDFPANQGALITRIAPNSPADRGGLQVFDLVTEANGRTITSVGNLRRAIESLSVGDLVTLKLVRSGTELNLEIEIEELPG